MSQINVNRIKDSNEGAPDFPSGVNVSGVTSTVTLGVTNLNPTNLNVSGVVTATTLDGNLLATGTPTLGLGVTINASGLNISGVATAGIVSATTLYGDGSNITGVALTIAPLNYNPALNSQAAHLEKASGIGLTFNQGVKAGSGNVTLSLANAGVAGTVVENFSVGSSVTYSNGDTITITPTADLSVGQNYHLSYPSGAFTNLGGDLSYVGTAYTFQARTYSYTLFSWGGGNGLAQNIPTSVRISSPVQVPGTTWGSLADATANAIESMAAIKTDGTLWSWGINESGMLGHNQAEGTVAGYSSPVQVGSGTDWGRAAINSTSLLASKTDGTLWATGSNAQGCLGQNQAGPVKVSSPVQIPGTTWATGVQQLASGEGVGVTGQSFFALKSDGTLWSWGGPNDFGGLGSNDRDLRSSPVQIPGTDWTTVSAGDNCTIATRTDGTLWSWGYNGFGTLGLNNTTYYSSPVQIPGTDWKQASMGRCNAAAIRTDGTLWCWGRNQGGSLGQGNNTQYSSPKQVPGTSWDYIEVGSKSMLGVKTDGTIWTWGNNEYGTLGQNAAGNPASLNSPVQVGSDTDYYRNKGAQAGMGGNYFVIKQA